MMPEEIDPKISSKEERKKLIEQVIVDRKKKEAEKKKAEKKNEEAIQKRKETVAKKEESTYSEKSSPLYKTYVLTPKRPYQEEGVLSLFVEALSKAKRSLVTDRKVDPQEKGKGSYLVHSRWEYRIDRFTEELYLYADMTPSEKNVFEKGVGKKYEGRFKVQEFPAGHFFRVRDIQDLAEKHEDELSAVSLEEKISQNGLKEKVEKPIITSDTSDNGTSPDYQEPIVSNGNGISDKLPDDKP